MNPKNADKRDDKVFLHVEVKPEVRRKLKMVAMSEDSTIGELLERLAASLELPGISR